jgi:hypothetical protein
MVSDVFRSAVEGCGPGSSVGIAIGYGLDGTGIESRWGRDFPHLPRPALGPTKASVQWVFPGSRKRPGRDADPQPVLVPRSKNRVELYRYSRKAMPLLSLRAFVDCEKGETYL